MARTIEIQTAQQVVLSYDLASVGARALAALADIIIQVLVVIVLGFGLGGTQLGGWLIFIAFTFYCFFYW